MYLTCARLVSRRIQYSNTEKIWISNQIRVLSCDLLLMLIIPDGFEGDKIFLYNSFLLS